MYMSYRRAQVQQLTGNLSTNRSAETVHSGKSAHHPELESNGYSWITNQRDNGFAVSTGNDFCKALQQESGFRNKYKKKLRSWERKFRKRRELLFRGPTGVSQLSRRKSSH